MARQRIGIEKLKPGMFVVEVSGTSSLSLGFSFKNFKIKSLDEVARLKEAGVQHLIVDTDKATAVPYGSFLPPDPALFAEPTCTLKEEMNKARQIQEQARRTLGRVMEHALSDQPIEVKSLTPIVSHTLDSLVRNDQALLTLMHMKRYGEALISHAFSVLSLATAMAQRLQLSEGEIKIIGIAALLYDVGWLRLPANLVTKGRPFSEKEQKLVEQHPELGLHIAKKSSDLPEEVYGIIEQHHEYLNGEGYPSGLQAGQITPLAQIITVCDLYDMMVHGMMGYQGRTPNAALKEIYNRAIAGKIDSTLIAYMVHLLGVYPLTSAVRLNTGELAVVVEMNRKQSTLPKIKIFYDASTRKLETPIELDLSDQIEGVGVRCIDTIVDPNLPGVDRE
jgi:HD-GYP domain-containing protein (c-di-GMP phosphodiesterase class II)